MSVKIGVYKGISSAQTAELLSYSNSEPLIVKFTHDQIRFRDLNSFNNWRIRKSIYTLTDETKHLLGLAWFSLKTAPSIKKSPFTFAIRIYPPGRGRGYSQVLMKSAFDKFMRTKLYRQSRHKGFWLITRRDNTFAIKLYEGFGFKKQALTGKKYLLMTFEPSF